MGWKSLARLRQSEPVVWIAGVITAMLGHFAATSVYERALGEHSPGLSVWLVLFLIATLLFYWAYENPYPRKLERRIKLMVIATGAGPWLVGAAAAVTLFGVAGLLHRVIAGDHVPRGVLVWYLFWFLLFGLFFYRLRDNVLVLHTRYLRGEPVEPKPNRYATDAGAHGPRVIIAMLSDVRESLAANDYRPDIAWSDPADLEADLLELKHSKDRGLQTWPWEMMLRALRPHAPTVRELILICSRDCGGDDRNRRSPSLPQAPAFVRLLHRYPEFRNLRISVWAEAHSIRSTYPAHDEVELASLRGFDFGELDELSSAMADLLKFLRFERRIRPGDLLVDFTGGTKPCSVVAAAATVRGEIHAQYVDTNRLVPTTYDLVMNPEVAM